MKTLTTLKEEIKYNHDPALGDFLSRKGVEEIMDKVAQFVEKGAFARGRLSVYEENVTQSLEELETKDPEFELRDQICAKESGMNDC